MQASWMRSHSLEILNEFGSNLVAFEQGLVELQNEPRNGYERMEEEEDTLLNRHGNVAVERRLSTVRNAIAKRTDEVTEILNQCGLPAAWTVIPALMLGGYLRQLNVFAAYINLELEVMARPTTMQVTDLVKQAVFRIEREITAENNKTFNPVEKLSVVSTDVGAAVSWFFPQQIQRT